MEMSDFKKKFVLPKKWTHSDFNFTGNGTFSVTNEYVYEGKVPFDNEEVKIKFLYEGDVEKGKWSGQGKITWADGEIFEGEFLRGKKNGKGISTTNGFILEADWKDGNKHGQAKKIFKNGTIYEMNYEDDKWHGRCKDTLWYGLVVTQNFNHGELKDSELTRKIKKEDFTTNMQQLTNLLIEEKKIHDNEPFYELKFKGKASLSYIPIEGTLYIEDVFMFDAKWENGKIMKKATFYDALSQTYEDQIYAFGIKLNKKVASTETTNTVTNEGQ